MPSISRRGRRGRAEPSSDARAPGRLRARPDAGALFTHPHPLNIVELYGERSIRPPRNSAAAASGADRALCATNREIPSRRFALGAAAPSAGLTRARAERVARAGSRPTVIVDLQAHWPAARRVTRSRLIPSCRSSLAIVAAVEPSSSASAVVAPAGPRLTGSKSRPRPEPRAPDPSTKAGSCSRYVSARRPIEAHEHEALERSDRRGLMPPASAARPPVHEHEQAVALVATRRKHRSA